MGQRPARLNGATITSSLVPASVDKNTMFDIFEPDTRGGAASDEATSTVCDFVAVGAPSISAISAQTPSTTSTSTQTEEAVTVTSAAVASTAVQTPGAIYAEDIYIGSFAEFATDDGTNAAEDKTTVASPEPVPISHKVKNISQEITNTAPDSATASQERIDPQTPKSTQASQSTTSELLLTSDSSSNALSDPAFKQFLNSIPICDYYPDQNLLQLLDSIKFYDDCIVKAKEASDRMFRYMPDTDWHIRRTEAFITLAIREQENKNGTEKNRLKPSRPAAVVRAKNATDPCICNDMQPSSAASDPKAELQDAVEGWRDTVDGRAEDYRDATYGKHWRKHIDYEDTDGIDNNGYDEYFPNIQPKVVYHSTAVQTKLITSPLVYEKVYGKEPTRAESRKILRAIGSLDYVDQSEVWYGKPFLDPNGPYLGAQTETQDSGFQTMDFEIQEANILKAKAKAGITASKLNKLSMERDNGIRVFPETSKGRVVHSQQFNAIRAIVDKNGTVESYGHFTPVIHNVVYEDIQKKPVITVTQAHATPRAYPSSQNLLQPKKIPSYCRLPSPSLYEDAQSNQPELFENGWPMDQFPPKEVDGTYSQDVFNDFGLPDPDRGHKTVREASRTTIYPDTTARGKHASKSTQKMLSGHDAPEAHLMSTTRENPLTPIQQESKVRTRKRSMGQVSDEGYKSHSPSSSKRQKFKGRTTASSLYFSTAFDTPLSSNAVIVSSSTSTHKSALAPKVDNKPTPLAQTSSKRKRNVSPAQGPIDRIEQSNAKRPRLQPTPTPIRRLPPTESTLKVIDPKGNLKAGALVNQEKARSTGTQAIRATPTLDVKATLSKTQQRKPARQQSQQPIPAVPGPAPAASHSTWVDRKPTTNRDNKKENPNRWRINLGAAGIGRRHDPYNASGRPGRRN